MDNPMENQWRLTRYLRKLTRNLRKIIRQSYENPMEDPMANHWKLTGTLERRKKPWENHRTIISNSQWATIGNSQDTLGKSQETLRQS